MADRYWVGGTDNWNATAGTKWATTSGGAGGASVPTLSDNVFFDAASGAVTVTITATANCDNLNFTGFTGTIAGTSALNVYGSLTLSTGMTRSYSGTLTMRATTTGKTITLNGKGLNNITFDGAGGGWTLQDTFTITNNITHTRGTLDTNGVNVTCDQYTSSNSNTRALTLGASLFICDGLSTQWQLSTSTGMTLNAGTSTIRFTRTGIATFAGGGLTYYNFESGTGGLTTITITGANTFNNITGTLSGSAAAVNIIEFAANQTINGTLSCASTSATARCFVRSTVFGTSRTLTIATLSATDFDFQDITVAGAAAGSSPTRAGDRGGNSGITFPAPKTVYWNFSGSRDWSNTGWATSSGGSPAVNNFPLAQDTAIFDNTGAAGTVTVSDSYAVGTVDMSARTSAMTLASSGANLDVYGNWTFGTGVTNTATNALTFQGRTTQTITSNGVQFSCSITVNNLTGTVQLADSLSLASTRTLTLTSGTFNAVTYDVTAGLVSVTGSTTRTLSMGSGTWTLSGVGTVWNAGTVTGLTFNKGTANIVLSDTSTSARTFAGGGLTYNKLTIGGATGVSTLTISGSNTFSELATTKTVSHTLTLTSGQTTTVTTWSINGIFGGSTFFLRASSAGSRATLAKAGGGTVTVDYADIRDSTASPVSTWSATNSTDSGNNLNWTFVAPPVVTSTNFLALFI